MGEAKRRRSATAAFIDQFPNCYFCGGRRPATTREHMPPKSLFNNSHRPDKLIMPACADCNRSTSTADLTASIVSRWNYHSTSQEDHDHHKLIAQASRQEPELIKEWTRLPSAGPLEKEQARQHLRNYGIPVQHDAAVVTIGALTICHLNLFAHKAVLALYFEHIRLPLPVTGRVCAYWKTKEDFARGGVPSRLLEIMTCYRNMLSSLSSNFRIRPARMRPTSHW